MAKVFVKVSTSLRDRLKELNDTELRVLFALGLRINEERQCWPTKGVLATECLRSERQVQRAIGKLLAKNFVWLGRRAGGRGRPNIYTLNGYFAYGSQPVQLMAPFMAPPDEKGDTDVSLLSKRGEEKGDIPIVADLLKGDMGRQKRETSPQADASCKKNHIRRTIKGVPPLTTPGKNQKVKGGTPLTTPGGRKTEKTPGDPRVTGVMEAVEQERGWKSPAYAAEAGAVKWMLKDYATEDILGCWRWLCQNPFWKSTALLMMSVKKQIGIWIQKDRPTTWQSPLSPYTPKTSRTEKLPSREAFKEGSTW